jgi:hypothetical protein
MSFLSCDNLRSLLAAISSQTIASTTHYASTSVILSSGEEDNNNDPLGPTIAIFPCGPMSFA